MNAAPEKIVVVYDRAADAARELRRLRRWGFRSPRDHQVVEGARVVLLIVPAALAWGEVIRLDHAIAVYFGYFGLRWFNLFIKPDLLKRFGPKTPLGSGDTALTMTFGPDGIRSETENAVMQLKWRAVPRPEVFDEGVVLRIGFEESLMVSAGRLPEGMTPGAFAARLETWRGAAA